MTAAVALKPIHKVRRKNLAKIVKEEFNGNASDCAREVQKSHTFMWQLVNGKRSIGEHSARHIEKKLNLPEGFLDRKAENGRTTHLEVCDGAGKREVYKMMPVLDLDAIDEKPKSYVPAPWADFVVTPKMFCAVVRYDDMREIRHGDRIYVDREITTLKPGSMFLVRVKNTKRAMPVVARNTPEGLMLSTTNPVVDYSPADARLVGRIEMVVTTLPRPPMIEAVVKR